MTEETAPEQDQSTAPPAAEEALSPGRKFRQMTILAALGVLLALLLYYPVGAWRVHVIDDDMEFSPAVQSDQSVAVAVAAGLLHREVDVHGWIANKPFFLPAAVLDDMPNYQKGMVATIANFAILMDETIGRPGESNDFDLSHAAALLQYPPNVWIIDPSRPWASINSSDKQYRNGGWYLESYNKRLGLGGGMFATDPQTLAQAARKISADLAASAATLSHYGKSKDGWQADSVFWQAKGHAYADYLLLRALGADWAETLKTHGLAGNWQEMLEELEPAARSHPWIVMHGSDDSLLFPNHLANEGLHLLLVRDRLDALAESLR